ncbi:MAG: hypothetical protein WAN35_04615 [Terracidiphilus sp.]
MAYLEGFVKLSQYGFFVYLAVLGPILAFAGKPKPCVTADQATKLIDKDICVSAHIYDVVELPDGTRYLDVCMPQTPDEQCRFTIVSLWEDREDVGELRKYRDMDVQVRGIVRPMHGRAGMVVSHARQFYGGPPKFKPNPRLARGFNAEESRAPIRDPNLRAQGRGRSFMNARERETLPGR